MKKLIFLICCVVHQTALADPADSLELLLGNVEGAQKVDLLNKIHQQYQAQDPFQALVYTNQALELAQAISYPEGTAKALTNLGIYYRNLGDYDKSSDHLNMALDIERKLENDLAVLLVLNDLGITSGLARNFNQAITAYGEAFTKALDLDLTDLQIMILNNMGNAYLDDGQDKKALQTYLKAEKALAITDGIRYSSEVYTNIGNFYSKRLELDLAVQYYNLALESNIRNKNEYAQVNSLHDLGDTYLKLGQMEEAFSKLDRAVQMSRELEYPQLTARLYTSLAEVYFARNQPILAYLLLKKQNVLRDSLLEVETGQKIARVEALYQIDENRLKRLDQEIVALQGENEKVEFILVLLLALVMISVFIGLYRNQLAKKKIRV